MLALNLSRKILQLKSLILVVLVAVVGCATTNNSVWVKDGASTQEFETDKYSCLQQSQQSQSNAYINGYGGASQSGQITNWNLYNSCMTSKGWQLHDKDQYQGITQQKQAEFEIKKSEFQAKMKAFDDRMKEVCGKPEYKEIMNKTPCVSKDVTFEQIADGSNITPSQKKVFPKFRTEIEALNKESKEVMRSAFTLENDRRWVSFLDSVEGDVEAYNLDLFKGKITWGEYNQKRKDLWSKLQAEHQKIYVQQ